MYKINKQKCTGCQTCIINCPGATKIGGDGKAEIVDQEKLEQCGGENICPIRAIEKINQTSSFEERGTGRGMGVGRGRGLGRGPRDGRGGGHGGGGRNY